MSTTPLFVPRRSENKTDVYWNRGLAVVASLVLGCVAAVAIVTIVLVSEGASFQRYCLDNPSYLGQLSMSSNSRTVEWDIQYSLGPGDVITALHVYGPIEPGLTDGPLHVALCGLPSTVVCDTSVGSVIKGKIDQSMDNSLKVSIAEIRTFPRRYYLQPITSLNTTGLRAPLGTICGTAS